jgi:hypothetical protein
VVFGDTVFTEQAGGTVIPCAGVEWHGMIINAIGMDREVRV